MAILKMERDFDASPKRVFEMVSTQAGLLQWWGPEGMSLPDHELDFSRIGPWFSVMANAEGQKFKVSGVVTQYEPPNSVGFTWGWHDDADVRGEESHVTFTVRALAGGGARLVLEQVDLPSDEQLKNHRGGWTSSLRKLEAIFA